MDMRSHGARVVQVYITPPEEYMVGDNNVDDLMDIIISKIHGSQKAPPKELLIDLPSHRLPIKEWV